MAASQLYKLLPSNSNPVSVYQPLIVWYEVTDDTNDVERGILTLTGIEGGSVVISKSPATEVGDVTTFVFDVSEVFRKILAPRGSERSKTFISEAGYIVADDNYTNMTGNLTCRVLNSEGVLVAHPTLGALSVDRPAGEFVNALLRNNNNFDIYNWFESTPTSALYLTDIMNRVTYIDAHSEPLSWFWYPPVDGTIEISIRRYEGATLAQTVTIDILAAAQGNVMTFNAALHSIIAETAFTLTDATTHYDVRVILAPNVVLAPMRFDIDRGCDMPLCMQFMNRFGVAEPYYFGRFDLNTRYTGEIGKIPESVGLDPDNNTTIRSKSNRGSFNHSREKSVIVTAWEGAMSRQDQRFEAIRQLIDAPEVYILDNDGEYVPVTVESSELPEPFNFVSYRFNFRHANNDPLIAY